MVIELLKEVKNFCYNKASSLELLISLITNNDIKAQSILELTTNKYFRRGWSSIYRALNNFYCSRNTIRLIAREEVEKFLVKRVVNDQRNFIQIDTMPNSKKHSAKAIDRMYIRSSNNSKAEAVYKYTR